METYAVRIYRPGDITGQSTKPLGILLVEAFDISSALIKAIKQCAKYYYEDMRYGDNKSHEENIPEWLLKYFREDYIYGTAFHDLNYKVLT